MLGSNGNYSIRHKKISQLLKEQVLLKQTCFTILLQGAHLMLISEPILGFTFKSNALYI